MAAMAGMYITGNATFASFGTGTIIVVAIAMLGSLTVLPAVPAVVRRQAQHLPSPSAADVIQQIEPGALGRGLMREPVEVHINPRHDVAVVTVPLAGQGTDAQSTRALNLLRDRVIPNTIGKVPGTRTHVGGLTAGSLDFNNQMKSRAPWVFAFVLGLAFCLLMVTFRSIV